MRVVKLGTSLSSARDLVTNRKVSSQCDLHVSCPPARPYLCTTIPRGDQHELGSREHPLKYHPSLQPSHLPYALHQNMSKNHGLSLRALSVNDDAKPISGQGEILLTGRNVIECEEWIRSIQKEAFTQGKTGDKAWMAGLASTRIAGSALWWYSQQMDDVTSDWTKLRAAVLEQYGMEWPGSAGPAGSGGDDLSPLSTSPVRSPTSLGLPSWGSRVSSLWLAKPPSPPRYPVYTYGHIKVNKRLGTWRSTCIVSAGYVCADFQANTVFVGSDPDSTHRVVVRLSPSGINGSIPIVAPGPTGDTDSSLYLKWSTKQISYLRSTPNDFFHFADLSVSKPASHESSAFMATSVLAGERLAISGCSFAESISISPLHCLIHESSISLTAFPDECREHSGDVWADAELIFEKVPAS